jgi:transcriptional regulator with XRE-family HTH domain
VDDLRFGRIIRAARLRRGWRQHDVAVRAGIDQTTQSLIERGEVAGLTVRTLRRSAEALGLSLGMELRGPARVVSLADTGHARLVEFVVAVIRRSGWSVLVEYTFNHFGERGSVDIVAWHPVRRALLVVEVKTRLLDVQELLATFDRKCRIVPPLLGRQRAWNAVIIGRLLVVADGTSQRRVVRAHAHTFDATLPDSARRVRSWLRDPVHPLAAICFVPPTTGGRTRPVAPALRRVRATRVR